MVAVSDFSGLTSCAWALARAAARAATESLDCCTGRLRVEDIKADCPRDGKAGPHPMPDGVPCIFRNEALELALCPLMLEKCRPGFAEDRGELGPGIRGTHIDN